MTVVVTGASGMIATQLLKRLGHDGIQTRALTRCPELLSANVETVALPSPDQPEADFEAALAGANHVVHCAAINSDDAGANETECFRINRDLTAKLARASSRVCAGRFIHLSSIRAVVDGKRDATIDAGTPANPGSVYGRSKLAGERAAAAAYAEANRTGDAVSLRLPPVYGPGMRGQMGMLLRLSRSPMPLPLASFEQPRSLVSISSAIEAILLLARIREGVPSACLAADRHPVTVAEILGAFREGLGRPPRIFNVPTSLLVQAAAFIGQGQKARQLAAGQVCDASVLTGLGWQPEGDTTGALAVLAAAFRDGDLERRS